MKPVEPSEIVKTRNLKSPLEHCIGETVRRTEQLNKEIAVAKKEGKDVKGKALEHMMKESARLNMMASVQTALDSYRREAKDMGLLQKANEAKQGGNSSKLSKNLVALGKYKPNSKFQAHHIICSNQPFHAASRYYLFKNHEITPATAEELKDDPYLAYGYRINDPDNGCWLPQKHKDAMGTPFNKAVGHVYIHTKKYAKWVEDSLRGAQSKMELQSRLLILELKLTNMSQEKAKEMLTKKGYNDFIGNEGK